ncbi:MAG TPA: N-acetylneuraminate synthase [Candidatus Thermoplasmatota archaeon]|nr:N-acetylneuraminate synthase [Candidatus Thermoplasmatota archaeon]
MMIRIGTKPVSEHHPCFVIAEAGVNHNGDITLAKQLVDAAKTAGADAVKFQTFKAEGVVTHRAAIASYARNNIGRSLTQQDMIKPLELSYSEFKILKTYCDTKKILFLSTPHSFDAIDFLDPLVPAYKFGSGDLTNLPALRYAAKKHKPIILGTGMATLAEVRIAIRTIRTAGNHRVIALHCTTNYPCPLSEVNLRAMLTMRHTLNCLVGYSDHTMGITVPVMAATLGAVVLEKHFTLDKTLPGPDHKASLEPAELTQMITAIREVETVLGGYAKKPTASEKDIMKLVRKSIVAVQDIPKGTILQRNLLDIKRPGTGLPPAKLESILGKRTKRAIKKDDLLTSSMVEYP